MMKKNLENSDAGCGVCGKKKVLTQQTSNRWVE